ncbi:transporter substrate-binding domain-containing protein [Paraburkholderia sp.]|uniref:transporter substrate-binding domain-containing protein n=1 Tax=Paraburkholderia sp. TaxID=1926495 RepID=UPI002389F5EE|nr:transporter substrate-binding domain-containing protein [Paraburkholderia sp.]MDE1183757.1 transporter substrate-binding domain-containing protein [Paraburkholderia sp.]
MMNAARRTSDPRAPLSALSRYVRRLSTRSTSFALIALVAASIALCGPVFADDQASTLKRIHDDNAISLGVREASVPFSYFDGEKTVGYSQAIALKIVDEIRKTLDRPDLTVNEVPITSSTRIPMLLNNQIDLECSSTTHTREREAQVAFSHSFFVYPVRMLVRRNSGIADFNDLTGKTIVTTAGTSVERVVRRLDSDRHLNMRIISAPDHPQALAAVRDGRAVAFLMDEPILTGMRATQPHPADFVVTGTPLMSESYACMFRKGDAPLRALVNRVIDRMQVSGDAERLYDTWFTQPIPPHGINLDTPLSPQMRALFAHPNDVPLD